MIQTKEPENHYISLVPIQFDLTDYQQFLKLIILYNDNKPY